MLSPAETTATLQNSEISFPAEQSISSDKDNTTTSESDTAQATDASIRRTLYFGYGSNLWLKQMRKRCPQSVYVGVARLPGWKWFINTRKYANIKPSSPDSVYGFIFLLSESDERCLDIKEGVPHSYVKRAMTIEFIGNTRRTSATALVYVDVLRLKDGKPEREYIDRINNGIADASKLIPQEYIDKYLRPFIPPPFVHTAQ